MKYLCFYIYLWIFVFFYVYFTSLILFLWFYRFILSFLKSFLVKYDNWFIGNTSARRNEDCLWRSSQSCIAITVQTTKYCKILRINQPYDFWSRASSDFAFNIRSGIFDNPIYLKSEKFQKKVQKVQIRFISFSG